MLQLLINTIATGWRRLDTLPRVLLSLTAGCLVIILFFSFCRSTRTTDKIEQQKESVINAKINAGIEQGTVNQAQKNTQAAAEKVNQALQKDSNTQSENSFDAVVWNWCVSIDCNDSICREMKAKGACKK